MHNVITTGGRIIVNAMLDIMAMEKFVMVNISRTNVANVSNAHKNISLDIYKQKFDVSRECGRSAKEAIARRNVEFRRVAKANDQFFRAKYKIIYQIIWVIFLCT